MSVSIYSVIPKVKYLTIFFNGGVLRFEPNMLIPNTKGRDIYFNPLIKYNPKEVYYIPPGQTKHYRYNKFFSSIAFSDQIIGKTLNSLGSMQPALTLEQAKKARIVDYNIEITLHSLFSSDNVLYINGEPYTIYSYDWNKEWQIDTKLPKYLSRARSPYASQAFSRYAEVQRLEAERQLRDIPKDALMSTKMEENINKEADKPDTTGKKIVPKRSTSFFGKISSNLKKAKATKTKFQVPPSAAKNTPSDLYPLTAVTNVFAYNPDLKERKRCLDAVSITLLVPDEISGMLNLLNRLNATNPKPELLELYNRINKQGAKLTTMINKFNSFKNVAASYINNAGKIFASLKNAIDAYKRLHPELTSINCDYNVDSFYSWVSNNADVVRSLFKPTTENIDNINENTRDFLESFIKACVDLSLSNVDNHFEYVNVFETASDALDGVNEQLKTRIRESYEAYLLSVKLNCSNTPRSLNADQNALTQIYNKVEMGILNDSMTAYTKMIMQIIDIINGTSVSSDIFTELSKYYVDYSNFLQILSTNYGEESVITIYLKEDTLFYRELPNEITGLKEYMKEELDNLKKRLVLLKLSLQDNSLGYFNQIKKYYNSPILTEIDSKELGSYLLDLYIVYEKTNNNVLSRINDYTQGLFADIKEKYTTSAASYKTYLDKYNAYSPEERTSYEATLPNSDAVANPLLLAAASANPSNEALAQAYSLLHNEKALTDMREYIIANLYLTEIQCLRNIDWLTSNYNISICEQVRAKIAFDVYNLMTGVDPQIIRKSIHTDINRYISGKLPDQDIPTNLSIKTSFIDKIKRDFATVQKSCMDSFKNILPVTKENLEQTCAALVDVKQQIRFDEYLKKSKYIVDEQVSQLLNTKTNPTGFVSWGVYKPYAPNTVVSVVCDMLNGELACKNMDSNHPLAPNGTFIENDVLTALQKIVTDTGSNITLNTDKSILECLTLALRIRFILLEADLLNNDIKVLNCKLDNIIIDLGPECFLETDNECTEDEAKYNTIDQFAIILKTVSNGLAQYCIPYHDTVRSPILTINDIKSKGVLKIILNKCAGGDKNQREVLALKKALKIESIPKKVSFSQPSQPSQSSQFGGARSAYGDDEDDEDDDDYEDDDDDLINASKYPYPREGDGITTLGAPNNNTVGDRNPPKEEVTDRRNSIKNKGKSIKRDSRNDSRLSYYIMIDIILSPGDHMTPAQKIKMACKVKSQDIKKALSETFGYIYAPLPLFSDYDVFRHDISKGKSSKTSDVFKKSSKDSNKKEEKGAIKNQNEKEMAAFMDDAREKEESDRANMKMLNTVYRGNK